MTCGRGWSRGGRRIAGAASALAALLPLALVLGAGRDEISDAAVPRPLSAQVTVDPAASGWPIPRSFLGASTEYWALPRSSAGLTGFERALSLLRTPGDGPLTIRIGGDSADVSLWNPGPLAAPPWLFALTPSWVQQAAQLVRDLRARLILDLNLAINSPRAAIAWVRAAEAGLPARSIVGFEIGNEPDLHTRRYLV